MKLSSFSEEQIVQILREAETGEQTIGAVCRAHGISENTFAQRAPEWRKKYGGADVNAIKRLRELELENARLKRILAERDLEIDVIKEVLAKK
jgi:putative transposase